MNLSRRLFGLWVVLAALWIANIGYASFVSWPSAGIIMTMQWALQWAILPPAALLLAGWLILWVGRRFRSP